MIWFRTIKSVNPNPPQDPPHDDLFGLLFDLATTAPGINGVDDGIGC